jgi:dTMP kinase
MFIVIEGIDGSGKTTIVNELYKYCVNTLKVKVLKIKFPQYESPYGQIISKYLNNEYRNDLEPWIINTLFDCDKFNYKVILKHLLENNDIIIADRYILSNIAYSCARLKNIQKSETVIDQLVYLNTQIFELPSPDITFTMDIDLENYLKIKKVREVTRGNDILENDLELLDNCRSSYNMFETMGLCIKVPYVGVDNRLKIIIDHISKI